MKRRALLLALPASCVAAEAGAASRKVDRAVVRFIAPETGGARSPRFVFARELAFESRLAALADPEGRLGTTRRFRERHVRAALERHIAETLLASSRIDPEPAAAELQAQTTLARAVLADRVGGADAIGGAADSEGLAERDVLRVVRRQARASLYLDRMVAPMLTPSRAELRAIHRAAPPAIRDLPFATAEAALRRWHVGRRLETALQGWFEGARGRITIVLL